MSNRALSCCTQILFKAGVHPEQPANTLDRAAFDAVWRHSVLLMQRGFQTGSILTVDPEEAAKLGALLQHGFTQQLPICYFKRLQLLNRLLSWPFQLGPWQNKWLRQGVQQGAGQPT